MVVCRMHGENTPSHKMLLHAYVVSGTSNLLRQAVHILADRTDSTAPSTAHISAATTLVYACMLSSAADVDHAITSTAPAAPEKPGFVADSQERAAMKRREMPVLQLLIDTTSWVDQCASRLSAQVSTGDKSSDELFRTVTRSAEVCPVAWLGFLRT